MYNCESFPLILKYALLTGVLFFIYRGLRGRGRFDYCVFFLILAAGLINIFENLATGCVYDPFELFGLFHFNWRDAVVTVGTLILVVRTIHDKSKS